MSCPVLIWFRLFDSSGKQWPETTASSILQPSLVVPNVDQFRKAVLKMYNDEGSTILTGIASSQLLVYRNKQAFVGHKEEPIEEDSLSWCHRQSQV
jgi:hypothetical protein